MTLDAEDRVIEATDLTPISGLTEEDEGWLRGLAQAADANALALKLSQRRRADTECIVFFDERSSSWWAGRYIGEVHYQDRTLRILPRFGMPQLQRWLSRIWGVRLFPTKGKYERARVWLWEVLARLWETRLLAAAKHGLPTIRADELQYGPTLRGRLQVRLTAKEFSVGHKRLVSSTRNRVIDHNIGGTIVCAFQQLRQELRHFGDERSWLSQRGQTLTAQLCGHITKQEGAAAAGSRVPVRYTPITESYRPIVELSRAISRRQPSSSAAGASNDVLGVLIDMAEVWELYVYHLLRGRLQNIKVIHTGRDVDAHHFLLRSSRTGEQLGGLKPDILLLIPRTNQVIGLIDAKYKQTIPGPERPHGILPDDLYQLTAYMSAYGRPGDIINGGLVYPATQETRGIFALQGKSPWRLSASEQQFSFFGLPCQEAGDSGADLYQGELDFIDAVQQAFEKRLRIKFME